MIVRSMIEKDRSPRINILYFKVRNFTIDDQIFRLFPAASALLLNIYINVNFFDIKKLQLSFFAECCCRNFHVI